LVDPLRIAGVLVVYTFVSPWLRSRSSRLPAGIRSERELRTRRPSSICLLALAFLTTPSARASARDLSPGFLALRSSQGSSLVMPWEGRESRDIGKAAKIEPTTLVYKVIAYVTKEVLDDASDEYRRSPVGAYLSRETPAQHARSDAPSPSTAALFLDSPSSLRYHVQAGTTLVDLWSSLHRGVEEDRSAVSLSPKFGAGKAGFVLSLRW
jgi:hypothetical protein